MIYKDDLFLDSAFSERNIVSMQKHHSAEEFRSQPILSVLSNTVTTSHMYLYKFKFELIKIKFTILFLSTLAILQGFTIHVVTILDSRDVKYFHHRKFLLEICVRYKNEGRPGLFKELAKTSLKMFSHHFQGELITD